MACELDEHLAKLGKHLAKLAEIAKLDEHLAQLAEYTLLQRLYVDSVDLENLQSIDTVREAIIDLIEAIEKTQAEIIAAAAARAAAAAECDEVPESKKPIKVKLVQKNQNGQIKTRWFGIFHHGKVPLEFPELWHRYKPNKLGAKNCESVNTGGKFDVIHYDERIEMYLISYYGNPRWVQLRYTVQVD